MAGPAGASVTGAAGAPAPLTRGMSADSVDSSRTVTGSPRRETPRVSSDGDAPSAGLMPPQEHGPWPETLTHRNRQTEPLQKGQGAPAQVPRTHRRLEQEPAILIDIRGENGTISGDIEITPVSQSREAEKHYPKAAIKRDNLTELGHGRPERRREDPLLTRSSSARERLSSREVVQAAPVAAGQTAPVPPSPGLELAAAVTHGARSVELATSDSLRRRLEALDEEYRGGFVVPAVVPPLPLGSAATTPASSRAATPRLSRRRRSASALADGHVSGRPARRVHFPDERRQQAGHRPAAQVRGHVSSGASSAQLTDPELGRRSGPEQRTDPELGRRSGPEQRTVSGVGREPEVPVAPPRRSRLAPAAVSRAVQTCSREPQFTWLPSARGLRGGGAGRLRRAALRSWLCQLCVLVCWLLAAGALLLLAETPAQRRAQRQLSSRRAELVVELATELRQVVPHQAVWRRKIAHYMGQLERTVHAVAESGGSTEWSYGTALYTVTAASITLGQC